MNTQSRAKKEFPHSCFQTGGVDLYTRKKLLVFFITVLLCSIAPYGYTQEVSYEEAVRQATAGNHEIAEKMYDKLLTKNPDSIRVRLGRGYVRSWQKRFPAAEIDFEAVLKAEPVNTDALMGLGYTYAWAGKNAPARERFLRVLEISPDRLDAEKGIAFTALWQGSSQEAVRRFKKIVAKAPEDAEASAGLGQALLAIGKRDRAKRYFKNALAMAPGREDAIQGIKTINTKLPLFDFSIWAGHTFRLNSTSIRSAELGKWIKEDVRIWGRYDNALSLDNPGLVREGKKIPSLFVGGLRNWGKLYTTKIEAGKRELLENIDQYLFTGEQVVYLEEGRSFKIGGFAGFREDDRTDWNIYTGTGIPLPSQFRIEPTIYYTETGGIDEHEWRFLLPVEYTFPRGIQTVVYLAGGKVSSEIAGASGSLWAASTVITVPFSKKLSGHFLFRHEAPPAGEDLTVVSFGLTFKFFKE